ncbi:hypothetical protein BRADI_3g05375v3 [Brachypodium distachyon]|uniref:Uncharacterized protein n=1 Tax=Brachypodium distachyon TaxID=15368 RepID=A0A2K2CVC5_BRADI|nr:hypothetical protein BRADI_3g05375v3 [Brachypodium distachyon]
MHPAGWVSWPLVEYQTLVELHGPCACNFWHTLLAMCRLYMDSRVGTYDLQQSLLQQLITTAAMDGRILADVDRGCHANALPSCLALVVKD